MQLAKVLAVLLASGGAEGTVRSRPIAESASITLRAEPRSVSAAREFVSEVLHRWDVGSGSDVRGTARLLVSELFTNAVIHPDSSTVKLAMTMNGSTLRVEVTDDGVSPQVLRALPTTSATDEHGRGLMLVGELAQQWGALSEHGETRVWFDLALTS